jgi:hypothetical protein
MSGGKGGSQTTKVEIPEWMESAAKKNLARGEAVSRIGYVPKFGPDVAAFNEADRAARSNVNAMAEAFGMAGAGDFSMPETVEAGGVSGYSSAPLFEQAVEELKTRRPGQFAAISSQFIDPMGSGDIGTGNFADMTPEQRMEYIRRMYSGGQFPV